MMYMYTFRKGIMATLTLLFATPLIAMGPQEDIRAKNIDEIVNKIALRTHRSDEILKYYSQNKDNIFLCNNLTPEQEESLKSAMSKVISQRKKMELQQKEIKETPIDRESIRGIVGEIEKRVKNEPEFVNYYSNYKDIIFLKGEPLTKAEEAELDNEISQWSFIPGLK